SLRQEVVNVNSLTPEQSRQLDELLQQAQAELKRTRTQQEATAVLARTQDQLSQTLADPNANLRDEALAAMSETLAAEPRTQALGDALQREDAQAASDALKEIAAPADQLSDVERQALRGQPGSQEGESLAAGTPVAVDAGGRGQLRDPSDSPGNAAGTGASGLGGRGQTSPVGQAAENVFVPGRVGNGPTDQDLVDQ